MGGPGGKKWPPEHTAVAPSLQVPCSPPLPPSVCRSDLTQKCFFSCLLNSDGLVCAALSPFAANHCGSCLPFLQGRGGVEGGILGFCSIVLCLTLRFPGTVDVCDALGMVLLCIKDSSRHGPGESTAEPRGVLSGHGAEIPGLAYLKRSVLKGANTRTLYLFAALFLLVSSLAFFWVLLSELSGPVRHKPPSLWAREGGSTFTIAEMTVSWWKDCTSSWRITFWASARVSWFRQE